MRHQLGGGEAARLWVNISEGGNPGPTPSAYELVGEEKCDPGVKESGEVGCTYSFGVREGAGRGTRSGRGESRRHRKLPEGRPLS